MKQTVVTILAALALMALSATVSLAQDQSNTDWQGTWQTSFGTLQLTRQGDQVSGVYGYRNGRLTGRVNGLELTGQWVEGSGQTDEYRGDFRFVMTPDGKGYIGRWGKGHGQPMPGRWYGKRLN